MSYKMKITKFDSVLTNRTCLGILVAKVDAGMKEKEYHWVITKT